MIELRFHRGIYSGTAIDEAVKVYRSYGSFELFEEPDYWVVRVTVVNSPVRERRLAGELGNHALGATIHERRGG